LHFLNNNYDFIYLFFWNFNEYVLVAISHELSFQLYMLIPDELHSAACVAQMALLVYLDLIVVYTQARAKSHRFVDFWWPRKSP
jgi:hypothetical protein